MNIEKIGHASVRIKTDGKSIYIDPFYTDSMPEKAKSITRKETRRTFY